MTSASIPFLLCLLGLALLVAAVLWLHDWWRGADLTDLRCVCGHPVSVHKLSDDVNELEPCNACRCIHWMTEDVTRARGVPFPVRHDVVEQTPLYDQDSIDGEYRDLCDGSAA